MDGQLRELIGSQQTPTPIVPPVWVENNGSIKEIESVVGECAFALVIGSDLTPCATSWRESLTKDPNTWLGLQLLILAIENPKYGSIFIDVPKDESPSVYWRTVDAQAKILMGRAKKPDYDLVKKHVGHLHTLNKEHLRDIQSAIEKIKSEDEAKAEAAAESAKKKQKQQQQPEEADEDEDGSSMSMDAPNPGAQAMALMIDMEAELARPMVHELNIPAQDPGRPASLDVVVPIPSQGREIMSKVTFTVSTVPDRANPARIVGYLVRILVHDGDWNPGKIIYELIDQGIEREANAGNERWRDPWPQYIHLQGSNFPVHTMTWGRWLACAHSFSGERPDYDRSIQLLGQQDRADSWRSPLHPKNIFTLRRALSKLNDAGGLIGTLGDYTGNAGVATWPECNRAVRYLSEQVFWDHPRKLGLLNQFFPHVPTSRDGLTADMLNYLSQNVVYIKESVRGLVPRFSDYRTSNVIIHSAVDADKFEEEVARAYPKHYYEMVEGVVPMDHAAVARYKKLVKHHTGVCMQKFCTIFQLDGGSPDFLDIPPQLKSMIRWAQTFGLHNMTLQCELYDPEMSLFANWITKQIAQYEKFAKIVRPIIPFKLRGCFSVYQRRQGQLLYNLNLYGDHGTGKSHVTVSFLQRMCIPGTFKQIDRCTDASDQSDLSVHDEIRGTHEMDEAFVSSKHAERHANKVNMKKSALTGGIVTVKTLEFSVIPGIGRLRVPREVTQAQNYVDVTCTNTKPDAAAIGSRFHQVLLGESNVPVEEMTFDVDAEDKRDALAIFRVTQFQTALAEKAMAMFAIPCRDPYMRTFMDISIRMLSSLRAWGVINDRSSFRGIEIMQCMARVLTIEKGNLLTFHVEGAPHYKKPFHPSQLEDAAELYYCDSDITLLTWSLHSSDWIDSDCGNVLSAAWEITTGTKWDPSRSMYDYFRSDVHKRIQFKVTKNYGHNKDVDGTARKTFTDLNYIEIAGGMDLAADQISARTSPRLTNGEVKGILKQLMETSFMPRSGASERNGYFQDMYSDDLERHRAACMPKRMLTLQNYRMLLKTWAQEVHTAYYWPSYAGETYAAAKARIDAIAPTPEDVIFLSITTRDGPQQVPPLTTPPQLERESALRVVRSFHGVNEAHIVGDPNHTIPGMTQRDAVLILHAMDTSGAFHEKGTPATYSRINIWSDPNLVEFPRFLSEADIPEIPSTMIHAVKKIGQKIYFSPMAIALFDKSIILDAFIDATICRSTRPGKRLLGWMDERDQSVFQVVRLSPETIDAKVRAYDEAAPEGAVLRENGIPFKRRGYIEASTRTMLYGIEAGPKKDVKHPKSLEVVRDLDRYAATQQHLICGATGPIKDPAWIRENYKGRMGTVDYPESIIREKLKESSSHWKPNASTKGSRKIARLN